MNSRSLGWAYIAIGSVAAVTVLGWQHRALVTAEASLQNRQLAQTRRAASVAERKELERRQSELEQALAATDGELAEVRRARDELKAKAAAKPVAAVPERFGRNTTSDAATWRNAGQASPQAALETALWAAAGGDVDAFAGTVRFMNDATKRAAEALLESLPSNERARYRTPEQLIAALTIPDVPTGSVWIRSWDEPLQPQFAPFRSVTAVLSSPDGKKKNVTLTLGQQDGAWRLLVSPAVVERLASRLKPERVP